MAAGKGIDRNVKQIYPLLSRLRLPFKRSRCAAPVHGEPNDKVITKTHRRLKLSDAEVAALGDRLREETDPGYRARLAALIKVGTTQEKMSAIADETRSLDDLPFAKKDITNITALIRAILGKSEPLFRFICGRVFRINNGTKERHYHALAAKPPIEDAAMITDIVNTLRSLKNNPSFYAKSLFPPGRLRPETVALLDQDPQGADQERLHRMILEDGFPAAIKRRHIARQTLSKWCQIYRDGVRTGITGGVGAICR